MADPNPMAHPGLSLDPPLKSSIGLPACLAGVKARCVHLCQMAVIRGGYRGSNGERFARD